MRSYLTRHVFRQILGSEPIVHRGCLRAPARRKLTQWRTCARSPPYHHICRFCIAQCQQRRSLFNFNVFAPKQEVKEADMEPGIDKMMELVKRERMRARMPPVEDVTHAFKQLINSKKRRKRDLTDTEAQLALHSLRYIFSTPQNAEDSPLDDAFLTAMGDAVPVLHGHTGSASQAHVDLARFLFADAGPSSKRRARKSSLVYIKLLCETGQTALAREVVLGYEQLPPGTTSAMQDDSLEEQDVLADREEPLASQDGSNRMTASHNTRAWRFVLSGFVKEADEVGVRDTLAAMDQRGISRRTSAPLMVDFSISRDDAASLREWWAVLHPANGYENAPAAHEEALYAARGKTLQRILLWCLAKNELDLGHEIVRDVTASNPPKPTWDALFVWAAGTKKSVDEVARMMSVMENLNSTISDRSLWRRPDIGSINALVEFAISINDPYMAERFISLGRDRDIEPDARTLVLQMGYRITVNDVDGALTAYKSLQSHDTSSNEDLPAVNRLLAALCQSRRHDFDTIMNVAADLSDRRARFEAPTASALSLLHLSRGESDDVIDLLNTHAFHYSSADRKSVRDTLVAFCVDPTTNLGLSWEAYKILRTVFDELARDERTEIMASFAARKRADMVVHVFQDMRLHNRPETNPTVDTYVTAFMGLSKVGDLESLEVIHNQLKLDFNINPTTPLLNSLIIAFTACKAPNQALGFWDDIVASREGPTYNSLHAVLQACEKARWGDVRAQQIWDLLKKRDIELDSSLWAAYIAALAGNGDAQLALRTLDAAVARSDIEVDAYALGSLYGACSGMTKQVDIETYALEKYPSQWAELQALGVDDDGWGRKKFKLDRSLQP